MQDDDAPLLLRPTRGGGRRGRYPLDDGVQIGFPAEKLAQRFAQARNVFLEDGVFVPLVGAREPEKVHGFGSTALVLAAIALLGGDVELVSHDGRADERRQAGAIVGYDADDDGISTLGPDLGMGQLFAAPPGDFGVGGDVLATLVVLPLRRRHRVAKRNREFGRHDGHRPPPS